MSAYWVKFETGSPACVEVSGGMDAALAVATEIAGRKAVSAASLPYPANPRLNRMEYGKHGPCPSFCFTPHQCAGKSFCPKSYACSE